MLISLSIRNIVIIDKLELSFQAGLCIISGETGAGKSIILDALGLALGRRGDAGLVRKSCRQGVATACFAIREGHPVEALLVKHGLDAGNNEVYLRRLLNEDGRSKAFINDNPVSVSLLSQISNLLIEVHSQHDERGFLQTHPAKWSIYNMQWLKGGGVFVPHERAIADPEGVYSKVFEDLGLKIVTHFILPKYRVHSSDRPVRRTDMFDAAYYREERWRPHFDDPTIKARLDRWLDPGLLDRFGYKVRFALFVVVLFLV